MKTLGQLIYGDNADKHGNNGVTFREAMNGMRKDSAGAITWQLGRPGRQITLGPDGITFRKRTYPVAGARAELNDFRSGLVGRKHTADLTITLASGEILAWHQTDTGMIARATHNQAAQFAAAVNTAAARALGVQPGRGVPLDPARGVPRTLEVHRTCDRPVRAEVRQHRPEPVHVRRVGDVGVQVEVPGEPVDRRDVCLGGRVIHEAREISGGVGQAGDVDLVAVAERGDVLLVDVHVDRPGGLERHR